MPKFSLCVGLVNLGFQLNFYAFGVDLYLDTIHYGSGYFLDGFIVLNVECFSRNSSFSLITSSVSDDNVNVWHARLGHIGQQRMNRLAKEGFLGNINKVDLPTCEHCLAGKIARKPF